MFSPCLNFPLNIVTVVRIGDEKHSYFASHWPRPPLALLTTIALILQAAEPAGKGWDSGPGAHMDGVEQDLIGSRCQDTLGKLRPSGGGA